MTVFIQFAEGVVHQTKNNFKREAGPIDLVIFVMDVKYVITGPESVWHFLCLFSISCKLITNIVYCEIDGSQWTLKIRPEQVNPI